MGISNGRWWASGKEGVREEFAWILCTSFLPTCSLFPCILETPSFLDVKNFYTGNTRHSRIQLTLDMTVASFAVCCWHLQRRMRRDVRS